MPRGRPASLKAHLSVIALRDTGDEAFIRPMSRFLTFEIQRPWLLGGLALFASFVALFFVFSTNVQKGNYRPNDIFSIWGDGYEIAHGKNPYSKIHGSDMLKNNKYSTYLPGFFLIVSAYVKLGYETFDEWLAFWKPAGFLIHFSVGVFLFCTLMPVAGFWVAMLGSQFWLLNRFTMGIMNSGQIDALAILLLLISLWLLPTSKRAALIVFGASLSIKQIGIFMLPVYLLLFSDAQQPLPTILRQWLRDLLFVAVIPFLVCLPFLIWDASGLILSVLFSVTRSPGGHLRVPSIDELFGYTGILAKLPMFFLFGITYLLVLEKKIGRYVAALTLYLIFICFNSILFKQYFPWFCGFLGLAMAEIITRSREQGSKHVSA